MDTFFLILGAVGSVASLIALWQAASTLKAKLAHLVYIAIISSTVYYAVQYRNELSTIKSTEREAMSLVENKQMDFTDAGFINAALAFLEKHKSEFPDTFEHARLLCEKNECFESENNRKNSLQHDLDQVNVAHALQETLRGIATMSGHN
jgi:hypothetical protein